MPTWWVSGRGPNYLKPWRYPGVPIPERLKSKYTTDPKRVMPEAERARRQEMKREQDRFYAHLGIK